jgi:hypothetical protein
MVAPQIRVTVGATSAGAVLLNVHGKAGVRLNDATILCLLVLLRSLVLGRVRIIGTVDAGADAAVGLSDHAESRSLWDRWGVNLLIAVGISPGFLMPSRDG